jgi:hypothetical protein
MFDLFGLVMLSIFDYDAAMFIVSVKKKALKDAEKMPVFVQKNMAALLEDKDLFNRVALLTIKIQMLYYA